VNDDRGRSFDAAVPVKDLLAKTIEEQ